jgi:hypothetical protein
MVRASARVISPMDPGSVLRCPDPLACARPKSGTESFAASWGQMLYDLSSDLLSFECAKARATLRRTTLVLSLAEDLLDGHGGVGVNLALIGRIMAAKKRHAEAKAKLRDIENG